VFSPEQLLEPPGRPLHALSAWDDIRTIPVGSLPAE